MSELINNSEERKKILKGLILDLHKGETAGSVREKLVEMLKKLLRDVVLFTSTTNNLKLRRYQEAVARAVIHSTRSLTT